MWTTDHNVPRASVGAFLAHSISHKSDRKRSSDGAHFASHRPLGHECARVMRFHSRSHTLRWSSLAPQPSCILCEDATVTVITTVGLVPSVATTIVTSSSPAGRSSRPTVCHHLSATFSPSTMNAHIVVLLCITLVLLAFTTMTQFSLNNSSNTDAILFHWT